MNYQHGGPAFPTEEHVPMVGGGTRIAREHGMTLRDYFAAKALHASVDWSTRVSGTERTQLAQHCYAMADAMLKARESTS